MVKIFVFLLLVSFSFGSATKYFQCSRYHKENWSKFGYQIGHTYKYNYTGVVRSSTFSIDSKYEETKLLFSVEVDITSYSPFDFMMQLSNSKFEEYYVNKNNVVSRKSNENQYVKLALSKHPLHFSYQNGRIDTICPGEEEKDILHIKKGILSSFQNSMPNFEKDAVVYETDVNGVCETQYKIVDYNGSNFLVSKTKNLDACSHRKLHILPWSSSQNTRSSIPKSKSLLKSLHTCTQSFDKNFILQSTQCAEEHLFQPFSNQGNGAVTRLSQSLIFLKTTQESHNPTIPVNYKRDTLLFDHRKEAIEKEGDNMLVLKLLDSLERKTTNVIDQHVAKIFSHLTHEFQKMSSKSIYNIFEMVKNSAKKKKFILDLLPLLTSVEGVVAMKVLYQQGEISDYQINAWLTSLTFVKEVSLPVIGELTYFLRIEAVKKKAVLSTTSLIYMYCKKDVHCLDQMEIAKALKIIEMPLLSNCIPTSPDRLNDILLSLKGVGNMGFSHSLDYLRTCYSKSDSPIELRLAAIAAHRRISCAENDNLDQLENYFSSTRQNSEIRIAAYLAAMQCASYATFARVKDVLRTEEISQVGSFVWTHLTNLQETSSKWKQSLKDLVGNEFLRNKFNTDFRRYSRNYEMSTFFESINTGATIESNVIFTPESYLPKSLMLNFTLDLFGESVNLLEVGARVEGYEEIIENLFGPDGYFPEETIRNALESFRDKTENDKIEELRKSFSTIYKEPNGLLYAKIFGNEISYTQFKDFEPFLGSSVNSRSILDSMMKFFRQQDIDYTKSFVFLDTTYRVPTLLGFPLELSINGTATLGLTVSGKVDLKEMWMHKVAIEGKVYASTAVEVVGTMNVDSIVTKTGLRSVSSLNSNIYVDGHAFIDQGKLIDLQFNVPKKQVKIINVESELFLMQGGKSYPIEDVSGDVEEWQGCTEKAFNNVVGFQICSGLRYVNVSTYHDAPYFPFSGKFKFFLNAQKTDDFDSYRLHLKVLKEERNYRPIYSMLLHFDTPNSKVNRKIETSYHLDCEKLTFNTKLTSPFLDWELDTKIGNEHDNLGFVLQTKSNNREILLAELSLISNTINNTWTYEPFVRFKYKDVQIAAVSGIINYLRGQKYNANLVFDGFVKDPIEILGDLHIGVKKFQLTGSVKSKEINGNTRATIVRKPGIVSIVTKTTYDYRSIKNQVIDFTFKYHSAKRKTLTEEMFYIFLNSTQMSFYNTLLHFNIYKDKLYFESDGMVTLFEETWQTRQLFKYLKTNERNDIALQCTLSCTKRRIDYEFNLSYIKSRRIFKTHGLAQLSKVKRIEVLIDYNATIPDNQTFNFLLYFPRQEVTVKGVLAQKTLEQYTFHFESFYEINDTKESVLTVSGDYRNLTLGDFQNHTLLAYVKVPKEIENTMNPWILELSLQMSSDLFLTTSELRVSENCYKSTIALAQNGFSGLLQINDKKLLIIHGEKEDDVLTIFLSLNVYQHFELSFKLLLPYQQLQVTLYWDKDRNMDNKISLLVDTNVKKGLYMLDLEYPRQKIMACFILLPTQVTVNVTWGIDDFQRIYLKAGNKLYDIGGIWFAKLETPLKYLEYQEFQLSYYLFPDNAEFKVDVSWQNQTINLILSGRKSKSKVSGYLDVNTTIPEISKIGIAMNHDQQNINGILRVKNDGTIILNNYQIIGQNIWQSNKFNVSTSFDIVSSGLFSPIWGSLIIHSNESSNAFKGSIKWKNKTVSIDYKLENQKCHAVIVTPFRGLEYTDLKYILIEQKDKLFFEMEMNIFKHHNRAVFFWSYSLDKSVTELNIISPLVGGYNISIGHNMKYGHLNEYFVITHGYQNEIVNAKLKGDFLSILAMNLTASIRFLKEEASVIVKNSDNPINSLIIVNWNKQYIKNALGIHLEDKRVVELNWNFTSTLLRENAMCKYLQNDNTYLVSIELPRHLKFKNVFTFKNTYKEVDNTLTIETSLKNCSFNYFHTLSPDFRKFDSEIFISTDNKESKIIFQGISNENLGSIASLQLTSYLHKPVHLNFSLGRNSMTSWNSNFYVAYDNNRIVNIDSSVHLTYLGSTMSMSFMFENYPDFDVFAKYDFISNPNAINLVLVKENFSFEVSSKFYLNPNRGSVSFNVTSNSDMERSLLNCNLNFNLENNSAQGSFEVLVPEQMYKYLLARYDITSNDNEQTDMSPPTTLKNWDKLFCNFFVSFHNMEGNFVAGVNNQTVTTKYNIKKSSKNKKTDINAQISIGSDFDIIKNGSLSAFYNENQNSRNFNVFGLFDNHEIQLQSYYDFNFTAQEQIYNSNIFGKVNVNYENLLSSGSEKYTLKMKILGKSKINKTSAQILTELDTNVPYFEKIKGEAVFKKLNYGHNVRGNLSYNNRYYNIHENFHNKNGSCFGVIEMTTPSLFGNFSGTLFSGDISLIEIKAVLRNYSKWYNMSISSSYKSLLNIDTFIDVTVPKSKYEGRVTNLITSNEMNCNAVINIAKHKNFVKLKMQYPNLEKIKVTAEASLPSSQFTVTKLNALYNFGKRNKFSLLQIKTNYGYNLNSTIDTKSLNINFSTPSANKGLVILGKHDFESVQNFSISYNVFFNKFWERVRFLYLQDDSVFHAQLLLGDENAEIKLDKDGLFRDQTILRTNYKDYALNIWSGKEKTYLTITNPSTIYKIQVNYISNYKQYGFEVFQDEMSLIDVTTTIIERNGYLQLQTRATNSLLSQYSDVVISLIYQTSELNFIVTNNNITAISVYYRSEESTFQFDLNSCFEDLKALQAIVEFQEDVEIRLIKKQRNLEDTYLFGFSFVPEKHRAGLKISLPCQNQVCLLDFSLKDNFIKLHAKTPIDQWKELKFLSMFIREDNFLSGEMQILLNEEYLLTNWVLEKNNDDVLGFFNIKGTRWQHILAKAVINKEKVHFIFEMNNIDCSIFNVKRMNINATFGSITNSKFSINYESQDEVYYNVDSILKLNDGNNTLKLLLSDDSYKTGVIFQSNILANHISSNVSSFILLDYFKNFKFDSKVFFKGGQFGFRYNNENDVDYWAPSSINIFLLQPSLGRVTLHTTFDKQTQMLNIALIMKLFWQYGEHLVTLFTL
ncbi:hypothetical protein FQR65_LT08251 [Abscondita terminalis]|nr:hypothetical protein FQR65_LT08251 [Abscondita terminalis]